MFLCCRCVQGLVSKTVYLEGHLITVSVVLAQMDGCSPTGQCIGGKQSRLISNCFLCPYY